MNRITEIGGAAVLSDLRLHNLDIYIKECDQCAATCRAWAETFAGGAGKLAGTIESCLNCAKACEGLSRAFLLNKEGVKQVYFLQIEACIISCRVCAHECDKQSDNCDGLSVCADMAHKCEDVLRMLLKPQSSKSHNSGILEALKRFKVFRITK